MQQTTTQQKICGGTWHRLSDDAHRWYRGPGISRVGQQQHEAIDGHLGGRDSWHGPKREMFGTARELK